VAVLRGSQEGACPYESCGPMCPYTTGYKVARLRGYRGGSPTAVQAGNPALCGIHPLVTPY